MALKRKLTNPRHDPVTYLGHGRYQHRSRTEPGKSYRVDVSGCFDYPLRPPSCECVGFEMRQWCQHIENAAMEHLRLLFHPKDERAAAAESDSEAKGGNNMATEDPKPPKPTPPPPPR